MPKCCAFQRGASPIERWDEPSNPRWRIKNEESAAQTHAAQNQTNPPSRCARRARRRNIDDAAVEVVGAAEKSGEACYGWCMSVIDLGTMAYREAWARQERAHAAVTGGGSFGILHL